MQADHTARRVTPLKNTYAAIIAASTTICCWACVSVAITNFQMRNQLGTMQTELEQIHHGISEQENQKREAGLLSSATGPSSIDVGAINHAPPSNADGNENPAKDFLVRKNEPSHHETGLMRTDLSVEGAPLAKPGTGDKASGCGINTPISCRQW
ncbi:hypothetical protein A0U91_16150 (plasmid) [Acetobacter persici]|uniref:Uncharacterized protein n=1 Tax=Acetobacter persici TaxID=1076596 RepID=A0A1U9LJG3_9PROT|nr:hypothetical protein A0U91_16150 [Acetobacter persici]